MERGFEKGSASRFMRKTFPKDEAMVLDLRQILQ